MQKISLSSIQPKYWQDILIGILAGLIFAFGTYYGARQMPPVLFEIVDADTWFEADIPRVFEDMTRRQSGMDRGEVHPLFGLLAYPGVSVLKNVFHLDAMNAVKLAIALVAFSWIFVLYALLRLMGCVLWDALLFCLLAGISAGSIFFFVVPETYSFGSVTILLALILVLFSQQHVLSSFWYVAINALTLSITTSNWMAGIFATAVNYRYKKAVQILINAFCLVTVLWGVQKIVFPASKIFLYIAKESSQVIRVERGGPINVIQSFFYHTLIMPDIRVVPDPDCPQWPAMITQHSAVGSGTPWGIGAAVLWTILLVLGLWALFSLKTHEKLRMVLKLVLLGQLSLHFVYGTETFLYSLHFIALLIPLSALSVLTKFRPLAIGAVLMLIPCVLVNNLMQFQEALNYFAGRG